MRVEWDYSKLADAYLYRPDYSVEAISEVLEVSEIVQKGRACDIGAGTGALTVPLLQRGLSVVAVEPNQQMAEHGKRRTSGFEYINWIEATAENTGQSSKSFDLVTFGSSFNVTDRLRSLRESARILKPLGWFACLFNHRNLGDDIQQMVQHQIEQQLPGFSHGSRREDQSHVIESCKLFGPVVAFERPVVHRVSRTDYIKAWESHCTLMRQAGAHFSKIIASIENVLLKQGIEYLDVPYQTRVWMARVV